MQSNMEFLGLRASPTWPCSVLEELLGQSLLIRCSVCAGTLSLLTLGMVGDWSQRVYRNFRTDSRNLGNIPTPLGSRPVCGCKLHNSGILVHSIQLVCDPAVTIVRSVSDTFSGIRPADVPFFIVAQIAGALAATLVFHSLVPNLTNYADRVMVAHPMALTPEQSSESNPATA
jgi:hypothetical protein